MKKFRVGFEVLVDRFTTTNGLKKDIKSSFEYSGKITELKIKRIRREN